MDHDERVPIVGIGASAGGVEALQALFRAMPEPPPQAAFVVVTHIGSGHESALPSILADCTTMPVVPARDGDTVEPGHAYVLPNDGVITIAEGRLTLQPQDPAGRRERQPIDVFLASLAADLGDRAVGIVLSGTGSDGTLGLKAVKKHGGLTIAQGANGTAPRHPEMPASAVAGGGVDLVLPVEDIPARVAELIRGLSILDGITADQRTGSRGDAGAAAQAAISAILRERTGHDFAGYKDKTFFRRVQRRIQVLRLTGIDSYVAHLREHREEADNLFRDLLISVTGFFRDPESFAALETTVIPALFKGRGADEAVRVWVPGCATGEEAYSLAILLREHMEAHPGGPRAQVFATDIDEPALSVARGGRYPAPMVAGIGAERLARHFALDGASYAVSKELRDLCVFSPHNIIRDAPFSRMDLVSCRNLLIYLGGDLQERVLPIFHYALRPGGFLFLGVSETVARHADLFAPADRSHRIFRRRANGAAPGIPLKVPTVSRSLQPWPARLSLGRAAGASDVRRAAERLVLDRFAPAHVVVDRAGDIVHQSARLGRYLEPAPGAPSRQLLAQARPGLRPPLRAALREAAATGRAVTRSHGDVGGDGTGRRIEISATPLPPEEGGEPLVVVVFSEQPASRQTAEPSAGAGEAPPDGATAQLDAELRETQETLQSTVEEYETTAEELKSANEELVSVNEELQSINEELETSKEELQSVNEELRTANLELSGKNDALDRANADLRNLFDSSQVATVFLDRHLVIRAFTPAVAAIFNLVAADVGRPLSTFASRLDRVDMSQEAASVLDGREVVERRVTAHDGSVHYLMRVLPYRTGSGEVDGVVVTFFDVTKVVEGEVLETLVNELNHRVRNMLQVVQAAATHTLRHATSLESFRESFLGRVQALGRAHALVSLGNWSEVSLRELLIKELQPYCATGVDRLILDGLPVRLRPKAALSLGMVLHELATNAAKHGALSNDHGRVVVRWRTEGVGAPARMMLRWDEEGGPPVKAPGPQTGFGTKLIEQQLRYDLGGTIEVTYAETGLRAVLRLPLNMVIPGAAPPPSGGAQGGGT
jgi:two-component system CheB/CheR fusion protein